MKFALLIIVPIVIAVFVGSMTKSWIWGGVTFPVAMLLVNWIAVWLFGRPDDKELRRITNRPVREDFSKEELTLEARQIASKFGSKSSYNQIMDPMLGGQNGWSQEKIRFYETSFTIDSEMANKVSQVNRDHYDEINNHWHSVDRQRRNEIIKMFSDELAKEWPIEYSELFTTANMEIAGSCALNVQKAYLVGYMVGKGWISTDELTNANSSFAQFLFEDVKNIIGAAKSRSTALAVSLMKISAIGTAAAWHEEKS